MDKLITRRNLLIIKAILAIAFLLFGLRIVLAVVEGDDPLMIEAIEKSTTIGHEPSRVQAHRPDYNIIIGNDLFVLKGEKPLPPPAPDPPDPTKNWVFQGTGKHSDGYHAIIADKSQIDRKTRKLQVYNVRSSDTIVKKHAKGDYTVRFLEVNKDYIRFTIESWTGHDLEYYAEDQLIFEMRIWDNT